MAGPQGLKPSAPNYTPPNSGPDNEGRGSPGPAGSGGQRGTSFGGAGYSGGQGGDAADGSGDGAGPGVAFPDNPFPSPRRPRKPPEPRLPPSAYGNRNWEIPIECSADALFVRVGRCRIALADLVGANRDNNVLLNTVREMVERRQSTVRPGEPLYLPQIRFLVWPDGFYTYQMAWPALEKLRLPMSRTNLDPDDPALKDQQLNPKRQP